ncbi:unnamed protein product [Cuscuta epithymum]|uniref:Uncharacterized protein n=1 Tax=Cuscuta epithymum TaxID=186058 RepID=A0AAV0G4T4_9ASTE|nr:unnamed protein product [Cuscuta epithymum]
MFMQAPIPYYDKMVFLYGKDRATGDQSITSSELRKCHSSIGTDDYNDSTTDSHVRVDDDVEITSNSKSKSTEKSKKSIAKEKDIFGEGIKEAVDKVVMRSKLLVSFLARKLQYLQARHMNY